MNQPKIHLHGKKQKPEGDVRSRLRAHILSGGAPKHFNSNEGLHQTTAGKMLGSMGIKKVFVTQEEHALLLKMRGIAA